MHPVTAGCVERRAAAQVGIGIEVQPRRQCGAVAQPGRQRERIAIGIAERIGGDADIDGRVLAGNGSNTISFTSDLDAYQARSAKTLTWDTDVGVTLVGSTTYTETVHSGLRYAPKVDDT